MSHPCFAAGEKGRGGEIYNQTLAAGKQGVLQDSKVGASAEKMVVEGAPTLAPICFVHLQPMSHCCFWWGMCTPVPRVLWGVGAGSALAS